jgi:thiamine biosynthesis protein ThiI
MSAVGEHPAGLGAGGRTTPEASELIVARYGELWLKGGNRREFERALARNVRRALEPISAVQVERSSGQLLVRVERRARECALRLQDVFGIASISPAWSVPSDAAAIARAAPPVMERALEGLPSDRLVRWRVETTRSDKRFPMISTQLDRFVAERLADAITRRLRVDLDEPELVLGIKVQSERTYLFAEKLPGAGGLPVGTVGRALCLLSGGIDSPVAAWMTMKRGCAVAFVSFHSAPYVGETFLEKVRALVRELGRFQGPARLYAVAFAAVQIAIRDGAPEGYRTVLYRRAMNRIACAIAPRERATALVTGESLGQVASQTLENLTCIGATANLPVLRPLIGFDKVETIERARRIGTFELSIVPEPDCCTVFQPRRPVIRGRLDECASIEAGLGLEPAIDEAVASARVETIG